MSLSRFGFSVPISSLFSGQVLYWLLFTEPIFSSLTFKTFPWLNFLQIQKLSKIRWDLLLSNRSIPKKIMAKHSLSSSLERSQILFPLLHSVSGPLPLFYSSPPHLKRKSKIMIIHKLTIYVVLLLATGMFKSLSLCENKYLH